MQTRSVLAGDGRPVAYTVQGAGPPHLLLIHGWCCHRGFWDQQAEVLRANATVVTLDLAGHGASPSLPPAQTCLIETLARDVLAMADTLPVRDVILVGHSLGGPVAVEAAILMSGRCRLVLGVETFTDPAFYLRRSRTEIAARHQAFEADFPGVVAAMVQRITLRGGPELASWIAAEMSRVNPATALQMLDALLDWDIETRWPLLPCGSETINSAILSQWTQPSPNLDGLRIHMMDGVGHFPMLEQPAMLTGLINDVVHRYV